jgi:hypothetical protein
MSAARNGSRLGLIHFSLTLLYPLLFGVSNIIHYAYRMFPVCVYFITCGIRVIPAEVCNSLVKTF